MGHKKYNFFNLFSQKSQISIPSNFYRFYSCDFSESKSFLPQNIYPFVVSFMTMALNYSKHDAFLFFTNKASKEETRVLLDKKQINNLFQNLSLALSPHFLHYWEESYSLYRANCLRLSGRPISKKFFFFKIVTLIEQFLVVNQNLKNNSNFIYQAVLEKRIKGLRASLGCFEKNIRLSHSLLKIVQ